jgi:AcrR family transcriptional regulator
MELYGERGFESTTVAEIAERAGLTERTFFRYFADKREVLFWGAEALQEFLVAQVDAAPPERGPIETITAALGSAADAIFEEMRDQSRQRQDVIDANRELQERELIKLASLAASLAEALRRRGGDRRVQGGLRPLGPRGRPADVRGGHPGLDGRAGSPGRGTESGSSALTGARPGRAPLVTPAPRS